LPDLYDYKGRLQRKIDSIRKMNEVSNHNQKKIIEFQKSCQAQGLSCARMLRYLTDLPVIASKFKKDPRDNLYKVFCKITQSLKPKIFVIENVSLFVLKKYDKKKIKDVLSSNLKEDNNDRRL
jgi:site-specific DNA-cytosine methylase